MDKCRKHANFFDGSVKKCANICIGDFTGDSQRAIAAPKEAGASPELSAILERQRNCDGAQAGREQEMTQDFIVIMDLLGTVAFAISGSMTAAREGLDLFGIMILALTTATGGGFIRDLTIGNLPPVVFRDPVYIILSFATAGIVFAVLKFQSRRLHLERLKNIYERALLISDTLGLAAFTVDGVSAGRSLDETNLFLAVFLGVVTGIGGGILRDLFAGKKPYVFVRHVYALASIAGAVAAYLLPRWIGSGMAMMVSFGIIVLIRYLAAHFRWDLPRIS